MASSFALPAWCARLRADLTRMASDLRSLSGCRPSGPVFRPEDYGDARRVPATSVLQAAVDAASAAGGGTVLLESGDYVSGTLVLASGVSLEIRSGARLVASADLRDYPEHRAKRLTVQDTSMGMHQSLIFAEGCENICLFGGGVIDGMGFPSRFPGEETQHGTPGRPFLLRVIDCRNIRVEGLTLKDSPCWMQNYLNCENLVLENLTVRNHANYNNDGIDIDGCRRVYIHRCSVASGDDALCFKGASMMPTEDVLVEDCDLYSACNALKVGTDTQGSFSRVAVLSCRLGGLAEDPSGLKHPGADSAVSLEMVDGGALRDFWLSGLTLARAFSPFFLRLENRGRVRPGDPAPDIGTLQRVLIEHVRGSGCGPRGSYLLSVPEKPIRDVVFSDVLLEEQLPVSGPATPESDIPDLRGVYPDAHMIDPLPAPAFALWARHVRGLFLRDYAVLPAGEDARPAFVLDTDVQAVLPREESTPSFHGRKGAVVQALDTSFPGIRTPQDLYDALTYVWCADTCAPRMRDRWTPENRTWGQCSITSFLAQDLFGGRVYGVPLEDGNVHCYNVIGSCLFDLTSEQFGNVRLDYGNDPEQFREVHFAKAEKKTRYEKLRADLLSFLSGEAE